MIQHITSPTLPKNYGPLTELPPALLQGQGLTLTAGTAQDVSDYHRLDSDPKLSKYLTLPRTTPIEKYPELLDWVSKSFAGTYSGPPLFSWLISLSERPNRSVGYVEASIIDEKTLQIGCVVDSNHHRERLSSKACRTLLQWATSLPRVDEIRGLCHPRNRKAQNLLRGLGMQNINETLTSERFTFPNYYSPNNYNTERSQMQVWRLLKSQNGSWPASALPSTISLNTSMIDPSRSTT